MGMEKNFRRDWGGKLECQNGDGKEYEERQGWRATSTQALHSSGWISELPRLPPQRLAQQDESCAAKRRPRLTTKV